MTSSLAAERTALAWRRTALGLVAGSVAAGRLLSEAWGVPAWGVAAAGTALAVVLLRAARRRRTGVHAAPRTARAAAARSVGRDPGGRLVTTCAAALVLLGSAALVVVLTWGA